jgi:hypothetical protein
VTTSPYVECDQCHGTRLIARNGIAERCPCAEEDDEAQERRQGMKVEPKPLPDGVSGAEEPNWSKTITEDGTILWMGPPPDKTQRVRIYGNPSIQCRSDCFQYTTIGRVNLEK